MKLELVDILLLDYLCELPSTMRQMTSETADYLFNLPHHCLSNEEVIDRVDALKELGLVVLFDNGYLGLTHKGGQVWESEFSPQWDRFALYQACHKFGVECVLFGSVSKQRLDIILEAKSDHVRFNKVKKIEKWRPFYWADKQEGYTLFCIHPIGYAEVFYKILDEIETPWMQQWRKQWIGQSYQEGIGWRL